MCRLAREFEGAPLMIATTFSTEPLGIILL